MRALLAAAMLAVAGEAAAANIEALAVSHAGDDYSASATIVVDAPLAAVRAALTDFAHLGRLTPSIRESRVVATAPEGPLVFTRSEACVGWFCREVRKTERIAIGEREIVAVVVDEGPERGTLAHGRTWWRLTPLGAATRVEMISVVDPSTFVPPLIGPPLVKASMKHEVEALARGLEQAARALASPAAAPPEPGHGG